MIAWKEELLARLGRKPIQEVIIVVRVEIILDGVAEAVLKGGEYGKLMKKMGRAGSGLGFALYTDLLERLDDGEKNYAADVMLVCKEASPEAIAAEVKKIRESGKTVLVQKGRAGAERCAEVIVLGGEV